MKITGSIQNKESISGAVLKEGNISAALSNPLTQGYSAYEIAVQNGFEGTEKEWLESLKGYSPIKGKDYWTQEDIDSILEELQEQKLSFKIGKGLRLNSQTNELSVDTVDFAEKDNSNPISSAAVYTEIGNINVLLSLI